MIALLSLTLRQLELFCAVVEQSSLTEAAAALGMSSGNVSAAMTQLEDRLGMQLAVRTRGRGVEITASGWRVYDAARAVVDSAGEIQEIAATLRGDLSGPPRLGVFTTLSPWLFPQIAEHFAREFPRIELQLEEGSSADLQAGLLRGRVDAALLYENHLVEDVPAQVIAPVRLQLAIAPTHPLASLVTVPLSALADEHAVLLSVQPSSEHVEEMLRAAGVTPRVRWRSANVETIRSIVARGLGYTIIMGRPYGDHSYDGLPIVYRPIADRLPRNAVVLATGPGARRTARVEALRAFCADVLSPQVARVSHGHDDPDAGRL